MRFLVKPFLPMILLIIPMACVKQTGPSGPDLQGASLALSPLPRNDHGHVDWVTAIREGIITPKESLEPNTPPVAPIHLDIVFRINKALTFPDVLFPHEPHTMWLGCKNCHPSPFLMHQGANPISMDQIVKGEFCGRCHGVVAFPIQECFRCHSRKIGIEPPRSEPPTEPAIE